jgi:hypothetical protein
MGGDGAGGAGSMAGLGGDGEAAVAMHEERTRCRRAELQARNLRTLAHPRAPPRPAHHRTTAPPHHRTTAPPQSRLPPPSCAPGAPAPLRLCTRAPAPVPAPAPTPTPAAAAPMIAALISSRSSSRCSPRSSSPTRTTSMRCSACSRSTRSEAATWFQSWVRLPARSARQRSHEGVGRG